LASVELSDAISRRGFTINNTSESWLDLFNSYENVIEKIIEFCYTPKTISEIVQEFNYVEVVIKVVFKQLVKNGVLEITGQNHDGQDIYRVINAPSCVSRSVSSDEITKRRRMWNKILVIGDSGVGKTALLRFVDKGKSQDMKDFGFHVHTMTFEYENQTYFVMILESTGKVWKQFWNSHCENAGGVFFVFDTTNPKTLESIDYWADLLPPPEEGVPLVIVENKIDLESQIPEGLIDSYVRKYGADHLRTNAKDDYTLEDAFMRMVTDNLMKEMNINQKPKSDSV
jgi:GTPase SAR1 family protein